MIKLAGLIGGIDVSAQIALHTRICAASQIFLHLQKSLIKVILRHSNHGRQYLSPLISPLL